jgi:hypothetical protein
MQDYLNFAINPKLDSRSTNKFVNVMGGAASANSRRHRRMLAVAGDDHH